MLPSCGRWECVAPATWEARANSKAQDAWSRPWGVELIPLMTGSMPTGDSLQSLHTHLVRSCNETFWNLKQGCHHSQAQHQHQQFLLEFSSKGAIQIPTKKWLDWCKSLLCGTIYLLLKPLDWEAKVWSHSEFHAVPTQASTCHYHITSYNHIIPTGHPWFWPSVASPTKTPDQGSKHWRASRPRAIVQPCAPFELRPRTKQQFVQQGTEATEAWASGTSGLSISWRTHCVPTFLS